MPARTRRRTAALLAARLTTLALTAALVSVCGVAAAPLGGWPAYGRDAQHSAISPAGAQALTRIRWRTPVDRAPQYSGDNLTSTTARRS